MSEYPDAFDNRYLAEFGEPFDSVEGLAAYLMHPDNDAPAYVAIRATVWEAVVSEQEQPLWMVEVVEMVTNLPEARVLMVDCASKGARFQVGVQILNAAFWLASGDDAADIEEEGGR